MANVIINDSNLTAIGNAIRAKNGTETLYKPREMAAAIEAIEVGGGGSGDSGNDAVRQSYIDLMSGKTLLTYTIPKETVMIPKYMFYTGTQLREVVLENPNTQILTEIGAYAFASESNLAKFQWPKNLQKIGTSAFQSCFLFNPDEELPDSVTTIEGGVFNSCENVKLSRIPPKVTRIESSTFKYCYALQITSLPEGVEYIGNSAFASSGYSSETRPMLTLPASLKQISNLAFSYNNFKKIRFLGTPDQNGISSSAFSYSQKLTDIYVPWVASSVVANAPWGATNATIHYNTSPDEVIE